MRSWPSIAGETEQTILRLGVKWSDTFRSQIESTILGKGLPHNGDAPRFATQWTARDCVRWIFHQPDPCRSELYHCHRAVPLSMEQPPRLCRRSCLAGVAHADRGVLCRRSKPLVGHDCMFASMAASSTNSRSLARSRTSILEAGAGTRSSKRYRNTFHV